MLCYTFLTFKYGHNFSDLLRNTSITLDLISTLRFIPFFSLDNAICAKHPESFACVALENKKKNLSFLFLQMEENNNNNSFYKILWFGAIIFHLAIFFTILKLPEIRSVLKFQCILFSKFFAGFFFIIFSLYNSLKKYTKKRLDLVYGLLEPQQEFIQKLFAV